MHAHAACSERAAVTVCQRLNCADPSRARGTIISWENKIIYYSSREKAKTINKLSEEASHSLGLMFGLFLNYQEFRIRTEEVLAYLCFPAPPRRPHHRSASSLKPSLTTHTPRTPQSLNPVPIRAGPPSCTQCSFFCICVEEIEHLNSAAHTPRYSRLLTPGAVILGTGEARTQLWEWWGHLLQLVFLLWDFSHLFFYGLNCTAKVLP